MERKRFSGVMLLFIVLAVVLITQVVGNLGRSGDVSYSDMRAYFTAEKVKSFTATDTRLVAKLQDGSSVSCALHSFDTFYNDMNDLVVSQAEKGVITSYDYAAGNENGWLRTLLPYVLAAMAFILLMNLIARMGGLGGGAVNDKMARFGEARIQDIPSDGKKVTFKDVAGADEEKEELEEIVQFLRDPQRYTELGAHIPKGVLLVGPPGTGKTLLAKAVAGEADTAFLSISGSDFVEMYVGVGASRVRDLFEQAKKQAPAIVFIDEIDAVGRQRGSGLGGGHDEREQTLNQLLVEMDGFESNEGVILISATNRPDVLDPALLRPGRFDRQVVVSTPDRPGRKQILIVHTKKTPIGKDVDLDVIARATPGFSGAELENLVNEAALQAAKLNKNEVNMSDFEFAKDKIFMGRERRSLILSDEEKRITAYHEGGHALTAKLLPGSDPVHKVSIVPRGRALGITMQLPGEDRHGYSRNFLRNNLVILLGGRVAEEIIFKDVTTGASNDIERVTKLARKMVTEWGMSDAIGTLTIGETGEEVFIGREWVQNKNYSEDTARLVDAEVKRIVEEAHERCTKLLTENIDKLHRIAEALIERETISGEELDMLIEGKPLPPAEEHPASGKSGPKDGGTPSGSGADFAFEKPGDQEQAPEDGARPSGEDKGRNAGEPSADTSGPNQEQDEKK